MIRQKISGSPTSKQKQEGDLFQNVKLDGEKRFSLQKKDSIGVVRIETSLKRVDSMQTLSTTPTTNKTHDLMKQNDCQSKPSSNTVQPKGLLRGGFDLVLNNQKSNNQKLNTQNFQAVQKPDSFVTDQKQNSNEDDTIYQKDRDFNENKKKLLKLNAVPNIKIGTNSFMQGDSLKQDATDRSLKSTSTQGFSVSIISKEFTQLSSFVSYTDWKRITKLELQLCRLRIFPEEIWDLTELRTIKLDNNYIKELPDWVFERPAELKEFSIANNLIKSIPSTISKAQLLNYLDFSLNHVEFLPNELFDLQNLNFLNVTSNDFEQIPYLFIKFEYCLKEFSIDWFRYTNPPMILRQGEQQIQTMIGVIKKDILNFQQNNKNLIQFQNSKISDKIDESSVNQFSSTASIEPSASSQAILSNQTSVKKQSSIKNLSANQGQGQILNDINGISNEDLIALCLDQSSKLQLSFLKFVRTFSKVFDLSRVVTPESGGTLAHQAVYNEDIGALVGLLNYDQQLYINSLDKHMHSPLSLSIREEQYYCAKILIYRGANVNLGQGVSESSCLLIAVSKLQFYLVKDLLERGAVVNHTDKDRNNCIHTLFKVFDNNPQEATKIGDLLLSHGAHPNLLNLGRWSPLHIAARKGNIQAIKYAIEYNKQHKDTQKQKKIEDSSPKQEQFNLQKQKSKNAQSIIGYDFKPKTVNCNDINKKDFDDNNENRILFKLYQRGGEEKMNILHISSQNCYTDIIEFLLLKENYNFTKKNGFDRNAYSLSQRHSTISKILKRSEVRMLDCFIHQDLKKIIENKMYDCCDDDLVQINPYQKSKAYNFYDQINQNNRFSAINNQMNMNGSQGSSNNQYIATEDGTSIKYGLDYKSNNIIENKSYIGNDKQTFKDIGNQQNNNFNNSFKNSGTVLQSTQTPTQQGKSINTSLKQKYHNITYQSDQKNQPYLIGNNNNKQLTSNLSNNKLNEQQKQHNFNPQQSELQKQFSEPQKELQYDNQNKFKTVLAQEHEFIKKSDSFHIQKDGYYNIVDQSCNYNSSIMDGGEGQHYLGSFLIQNSLQAFRKSREDFQKLQEKMYPNRPLPQTQNRNMNLLDIFSNDNLNSDSILNASDEIVKPSQFSPNRQKMQLKNQQQDNSQYINQQKIQYNDLFSLQNNQKNFFKQPNSPIQNKSQSQAFEIIGHQSKIIQENQGIKKNHLNQNLVRESDEIDSAVDQIGEEQAVKISQIFSWSKMQPKLIQDKLDEDKKKFQDFDNGSLNNQVNEDITINGDRQAHFQKKNPKPFQYKLTDFSEKKQQQRAGEKMLDIERIQEILDFSIDESDSSDENNTDELQENIEESLNENFSNRIMPYSSNNLKHLHPSFFQPTVNNLIQSQSIYDSKNSFNNTNNSVQHHNDQIMINYQNFFNEESVNIISNDFRNSNDPTLKNYTQNISNNSLFNNYKNQTIDITNQIPFPTKKNQYDDPSNIFKSNLSGICNSMIQNKPDYMLTNDNLSETNQDSISLNEQMWGKHCFKIKLQKKIDQLLDLLKHFEQRVKKQDLILSRRLESLNKIKEIETSLKGILKELISNKNFREANQYDMTIIQQHISNAISTYNHTINQLYFYFTSHMQQQKMQVDYFKKASNVLSSEIKLEKDSVQLHRHFAQERLHDQRQLHILFQQLFSQNNIIVLRKQLGYLANNNITPIKSQNQQYNSKSKISNEYNQTNTNLNLNKQYDSFQMSTNILYYFETVQRMQLHSVNPSSRTQILNETQLMQTLPTEEEYDTCQVEQPSAKFSQYTTQKPKQSSLQKRFLLNKSLQK